MNSAVIANFLYFLPTYADALRPIELAYGMETIVDLATPIAKLKLLRLFFNCYGG